MSPPTLAPAATAESTWSRWTTTMQLVVTDAGRLGAARREVDAELDAVELAASRFRPDSEVSRLVTAAGRPTEVSELLAELIGAALTAARRTDGDVDPTLGAALIALGYNGESAGESGGESGHRLASVTVPADWTMVRLHDRAVTLPPGVLLDLGATAKAVAADRAAQRAFRASGCGVLVSLGGDIATAGPAPDGGWHVGVRDGGDEPACAVTFGAGVGLATSSTLHRRWSRDGERRHHILDPRTRRPADPVWRTVSVCAPSCAEANTMSTAAVVRGRRALDWLAALNVPSRLVDQDRAVHTVGGWPRDPGEGRP